ncbi:SRPBCC family protein [Streptomyces sp. ISL-90]|nr:SRPBCC family protein [Streptomyces sp. ISL-90]
MTEHTTVHSTFALERQYPHPPTRVFGAFSNEREKAKWFADPAGGPEITWEFDFREGGRELNSGPYEGRIHTFEAIYHDIVEHERIVYSYTMIVDGVKLSASLATLVFEPIDGGTRLTLTEQGAFFDGHDDPAERERGTIELLDLLGASLDLSS